MQRIIKYPRTPHLEGSAEQPGDEDLKTLPFATFAGRRLVVEEKLDGANCGIGFDDTGRLWLQSRGHYLTGGPREAQFDLLKNWAAALEGALWAVLGPRYLMFGEWLYARHTLFYDRLPHYFVEFDVLDRQQGVFLSTDRRAALLAGLPIVSAPVLWQGVAGGPGALTRLVGPSRFRSRGWPEALRQAAEARGLDVARTVDQSDPSPLMEGLYIKAEVDGAVVHRCKYVRPGFRAVVDAADDHWQARPLLPNRLAPGASLFGVP